MREDTAATPRRIFVFGSNLAGLHGAGSAQAAYKQHGAQWRVGVGPVGNSYAIPTKDEDIRTMSLVQIAPYVADFLRYARENPDLVFDVVRIGCGLAGYSDRDMAPLFAGAPDNVVLPDGWRALIAGERPAGVTL